MDSESLFLEEAPPSEATPAGVRWNDPAFAIAWPLPVTAISARDQQYADYTPNADDHSRRGT